MWGEDRLPFIVSKRVGRTKASWTQQSSSISDSKVTVTLATIARLHIRSSRFKLGNVTCWLCDSHHKIWDGWNLFWHLSFEISSDGTLTVHLGGYWCLWFNYVSPHIITLFLTEPAIRKQSKWYICKPVWCPSPQLLLKDVPENSAALLRLLHVLREVLLSLVMRYSEETTESQKIS